MSDAKKSVNKKSEKSISVKKDSDVNFDKKSDKKSDKKVEKVKVENLSRSDEPNWYHYLIVLGVFAAIIGIFWAGYILFVDDEPPVNNGPVLYKYSYRVGNVTYNLYFDSKVSDIREMPYPVELDKYDLLNTINFRMSFAEYNGSDNGQVAKASTKLTSFLKFVYHFQFGDESFTRIENVSCLNSTMRNKVITFDPYSDVNGVFFNETNGCIEFKSDDAKKMVDLADKFIYEMVDLKNVD